MMVDVTPGRCVSQLSATSAGLRPTPDATSSRLSRMRQLRSLNFCSVGLGESFSFWRRPSPTAPPSPRRYLPARNPPATPWADAHAQLARGPDVLALDGALHQGVLQLYRADPVLPLLLG